MAFFSKWIQLSICHCRSIEDALITIIIIIIICRSHCFWTTYHVAHVLLVGHWCSCLAELHPKEKLIFFWHNQRAKTFLMKRIQKWKSMLDWDLSVTFLLAKVQIRTQTVTPHSHYVFIVKNGKRIKPKK